MSRCKATPKWKSGIHVRVKSKPAFHRILGNVKTQACTRSELRAGN